MDLKALIAKMDHIESKQLLNEGFPTVADAKARADKEKTTGKFDKKELSTGTQYTRKSSTFDDGGKDKDQKKAEKKKKNEDIDFQSSIARALLREFNLEEAPIANPYQGADAAKFAAMSPQDQAWLTKGGGKPDINDEFILARAPNKGKPAAPAAAAPAAAAGQAVNPDSQQGQMMAAQTAGMNEPQSGVAGVQGGSEQDRMLAAQTAGMDKPPAAPAAPAAPAKPATPAKPAKPAAPAANKAMTPAINAYASRMGLLKNNKPDVEAIKKFQQANGLKADGIIGPNTAGAILSSQKPGAPMGGGGGGPAPANQIAAAPAAKPAPYNAAKDSQAANVQQGAPAAAPAAAPAKTFAQDKAERQAMRKSGALGSGTFQTSSVRNEDDAILERIRSALR